MWRPFVIALLSVLVAAAAIHPGWAAAAYSLGAGDEVQLKVYEWRSAVGDVHEWAALNGKFEVGADGNVSLPLIGAVPATGRTPEQLAAAIAVRLQQTVGLATRPQASVGIVKYRPFFILVSVDHPGEYPYRPGITVLQAVSIAGGLYRMSDPSLLLGQRGMVATARDLRVLQIEYAGLLARRARLQAELDGGAKIAFPPELQSQDPGLARVIAQEQAMFAARRDALRSETDVLNQLKNLLNGEVTSLQAKIKNLDQELGLLKQELASTSSLVQRGLAAAPREFTLRQSQLQTEGRRLDLDAAVLRAREDIGKADQALIQLRNKRSDETLTELAQIESKLSQTVATMKTTQMLLAQDSAAPDLATMLGKETAPPLYTIIRGSGKGMQKITATEASAVGPGDTIEVKRRGAAPSLPTAEVGASGTIVQENGTGQAVSAGKAKAQGR